MALEPASQIIAVRNGIMTAIKNIGQWSRAQGLTTRNTYLFLFGGLEDLINAKLVRSDSMIHEWTKWVSNLKRTH